MSDKKQDTNSEEEPSQDGGPPAFVSTLNSLQEQVGSHVMSCLQTNGTVAVISTVVAGVGSGGDKIVSMPITAEQMAEIDLIINRDNYEPAHNEDRCIGFQCNISEE